MVPVADIIYRVLHRGAQDGVERTGERTEDGQNGMIINVPGLKHTSTHTTHPPKGQNTGMYGVRGIKYVEY